MSRVVDKWLLALAKPGYSSTNFPSKKLKPYQLNELIESADWHSVLPCVVNNIHKAIEDSSEYRIVHCKEPSNVLRVTMSKALSNLRKRAAKYASKYPGKANNRGIQEAGDSLYDY